MSIYLEQKDENRYPVELSIVIPFLNEEENIETLFSELNNHLKVLPVITEVVLVDDGSTDDSVLNIRKFNHLLPQVRLVQLSRNFGSLAALRAGVQESRGKWVLFLYADLQDPPTLIGRLYTEVQKGFDIVWACRSDDNQGFVDRLFPRFYAWLMRKYAVSDFPDNGFDVVMFNYKVKNQLNKRKECHSSIFLQILRMGFRKSSITYQKEERLKGQTKWTFSKKLKLVIDSFVAFSYAPIRLVTVIGLLMAVGGLLWLMAVITFYIIGIDAPLGWFALMSAVLISCGVTNFSLGILAEYLWRTYDAAKNMDPFIIDEVTDFEK